MWGGAHTGDVDEQDEEGDGELEGELLKTERQRSSSKAEEGIRVICRLVEALQRGYI